jgi:hypothetical protein|nr:MAG TPA: hypothetical protein [Caudoviricetes sp.]
MEKETRTEIVNSTTAGMLQINAPRFDCDVVELGIAGQGEARITVSGTNENITALFEYVSEAGK